MHSYKRLAITLMVVAASLGASSIGLAKDVRTLRKIDATPRVQVVPGFPYAPLGGTCTIGVDLAPAFVVDYFLPPNDQYYTLLDPAACSGCGGMAAVTAVHAVLFFQASCVQSIDVSIIGVSPDDPTCTTPNAANVIMDPVPFVLEPTATGTPIDFTMPLPETVCLDEPAFLCYTINEFGAGCDGELTRPLLVAAGSGCSDCISWNAYDTFQDDLCQIFPPGGVGGPPLFYAEAVCEACGVTPTLPESWGSLKIRYGKP